MKMSLMGSSELAMTSPPSLTVRCQSVSAAATMRASWLAMDRVSTFPGKKVHMVSPLLSASTRRQTEASERRSPPPINRRRGKMAVCDDDVTIAQLERRR
jgi:hypothetical protein